MDDISVASALSAHAPLIQNLMQLYTHDFSEFWAGTARGEVDGDGRFEAYPLDAYWRDEDWSAILVLCGRMVAGFALVNNETHSGRPANRNMGEFFILRKYRGQGVGRVAAELIFSLYQGVWEVAVARKNTRAWAFWRNMVRNTSRASVIEELDIQNAHWNGPILRFEWGMM